ncbi:peptidyl-prolyl cis-trans isomerase FKBP62-like [Spinacia oleracea]|uniref:Peptidyl-prolyl cis-trans isomerase FKBP62-like n=1 Tax=Spinacia oleracea TaxID=3562 RepID=A0ABM3QHU1_SPIOL|nr:peptidyl-prolyl cis-trans isomerase FKBP62-like [Spinacia oleracea]
MTNLLQHQRSTTKNSIQNLKRVPSTTKKKQMVSKRLAKAIILIEVLTLATTNNNNNKKSAPLTVVRDDSYEDALDDDQLKQGKYDETVKECSKAIELNPAYVKALLRRGEAYEKLERYEEAISDMKKILEVEASNEQARRNIVRMEPLAREKAEKMKEEMTSNLFLLHTSADPLLYLHSPL